MVTGTDLSCCQDVAVKLESRNSKHLTLSSENKIYKSLQGAGRCAFILLLFKNFLGLGFRIKIIQPMLS